MKRIFDRCEAILLAKVQVCALYYIQCLCNFKDLIAQFFLIRYVEEEIVQLRSRFYQIALSPAKQNKKKYKTFQTLGYFATSKVRPRNYYGLSTVAQVTEYILNFLPVCQITS